MEKTQNYQLPQWGEGDPVRREDFNEAMEHIDNIFVIGQYTATGEEQSIDVGFRPRFLIITGGQKSYYDKPYYYGYHAFTAGYEVTDSVVLTDNGFTVKVTEINYYPKLDLAGRQYSYIAFR